MYIDLIDKSVRLVKRNTREAFGGMQLLFCGDFLQLPPVPDNLNKKSQPGKTIFMNKGFAFQSEVWWDANFYYCALMKVMICTDKCHGGPIAFELTNKNMCDVTLPMSV